MTAWQLTGFKIQELSFIDKTVKTKLYYLHNSGVELNFNFDQIEDNSNEDDDDGNKCQSCHRLMMCSILKQMMITLCRGAGRTAFECSALTEQSTVLNCTSWTTV